MLGDNIRKYRKLNNMSQDELAEKLNVTRQSVSLWENGQTQPSLENIVALAKLFEVSTDELLVPDNPSPSTQNALTVQEAENPKKKVKPLFLILGIVIAVSANQYKSNRFQHRNSNNNSQNQEKRIYFFLGIFRILNSYRICGRGRGIIRL